MRSRLIIIILGITIILITSLSAGASVRLQELSNDLVSLARDADPGIVEVRSAKNITSPVPIGVSVGTGIVIDSDGYILTTKSVVEDTAGITVRFMDGDEAKAELMGVDPFTEIAVIRVDKKGLKALPLGNSDVLEPGALVVMINNQAGMRNSVSLGIVSGIGRSIGRSGLDMIQISGTIGPGASGGPVFDPGGNVVAITAAMLSPTSTALPFNLPALVMSGQSDAKELQGQLDELFESLGFQRSDAPEIKREIEITKTGKSDDKTAEMEKLKSFLSSVPAIETIRMSGNSGFAIPINRIKPFLDDLKSGKDIERGWLGVVANQVGDNIVLTPEPGGPAAKAGVKAGDVLIKTNQYRNALEFSNYIVHKKPGEKLPLTVKRNGRNIELTVILGKRPGIAKPSAQQTSISIKLSTRPGDPVVVNMVNASIEQAAQVLSGAYGVKIAVEEPEKINKTVTVNINTASVKSALDTLCKAAGCKYRKTDDGYTIIPE